MTIQDIPAWKALSSAYDIYVRELTGTLTEWYKGSGDTLSFYAYMDAKIAQQEAYMAIDSDERCLGVIAVSCRKNRITFFGISHSANFQAVGNALLSHALNRLDHSSAIHIQIIASRSAWIEQHRKLIKSAGFMYTGGSLENGVPVSVFVKLP